MPEIWLATQNRGKIQEFRPALEAVGFQVHSPQELSFYTEPPETGDTFLANATIKARALRAIKPGQWILADDSGLEAEGLKGLPGIHSARYAGAHASDVENIAKLLKMLKIRSPGQRAARFVAVLVAIDPTGKEEVYHGELQGSIASAPRGTQGFGYDPVFIPKDETQTLAELGLAYKNRVSHRAAALKKFLASLKPD